MITKSMTLEDTAVEGQVLNYLDRKTPKIFIIIVFLNEMKFL